MIALGLVILIAGCAVAVYRSGQDGTGSEDHQADDIARRITSDFGSGAGALSMTKLGAGYQNIEVADGKSVMIRVETMDGDEITLYLPDKDTFEENSDKAPSSANSSLPISTDDGRIVPGKLEVKVVG
ncbi:MAG: hypothetical protein ACMUHM_08020 [Thermoplasmatota archaeon]